MPNPRFPEWLILWIWRGLLGEIYPNIRAIAAAFSPERALTIRYYLDRKPTEGDRESLSMVMTQVLANTSSNEQITAVQEECLFSDAPIGKLDPLDVIVYARREYELHEVQTQVA